jgi:hypothetical protein
MDDLRKNKDKIHDFLEGIATLEEDKEIGLYVDVNIRRGLLSSPKSIEKDKVERHLAHIRKLFEFTRPLLMTPIPLSETKRVKTLMEESGILKDFLKAM